ncbi:MAG: permease-like cell division protein FtsX [bacterium]
MVLIPLYRAVKFALQNFWRNIWLSLITIFIILLTLLLINILITVNILANHAIKLVEEKVDVSVYFNPQATENQVLGVREQLLTLATVQDVKYISEEEALTAFKELHKDDPKILESLAEIGINPLGSTLIVRANNPQDYPAIIESLTKEEYSQIIEDMDLEDHQEVISRITNLTAKVYQVGLVLSIIFSVVVLLIVFNTIRIAIYTHREEIGIMKLVGANNWFVRLPFIIEGVFYSLVACVLTAILIYPLLGILQSYVGNFFDSGDFNIVSYFTNNFLTIFGLELLAMVILNVISTAWATRKYLKV